MRAYTPHLIAAALGLSLSMPVLAQHGRPPLYWEVTSISAKTFTIFPGSNEAVASAINNLGEIVGWARTSTGDVHAFKRGLLGATVDIGAEHPWHDTMAVSINDLSEVVGYGPGFGGPDRGFYWSAADGFSSLSSINPPGVTTWRHYYPAAINNLGRIVGTTTLKDWTGSIAVTWWHRSADPALFYSAPSGRDSLATDVNDDGMVTGAEYTPVSGDDRVFRERYGAVDFPNDPWRDAKDQRIYAVNEYGVAVGSAMNAQWENKRAILWRPSGRAVELGKLPGGTMSEAFDINDRNFVVGHSTMDLNGNGSIRERAFLYHSDFGMVQLPPPSDGASYEFCSANGINELKANGLLQVAGFCTRDNKFQALRWDVFIGEHP